MADSKTVLLNYFGGGSLERRTRTNSKGESSDRYTASIDAKSLKLDFDPKTLGGGVAAAITEHLKKRIADISAEASPATLRYRKSAAKALSNAAPWALKRYAGGRTGIKPPNQSTRLFNDSGRLVASLIAQPTRDNNWVVNVAANRLNLGSDGKTASMIERLREFVPEFGSASHLLGVPEIQIAVRDATQAILAKSPKGQKIRDFVKELTKVAITEFAKGA
jgi:hypothetical protein